MAKVAIKYAINMSSEQTSKINPLNLELKTTDRSQVLLSILPFSDAHKLLHAAIDFHYCLSCPF